MQHRSHAVVTGGSGFIGSHLCDRLINEGISVTCVDNLSTGSLANIRHLLDFPQFTFINHDITIPIEIEADQIFNLACPASPVQYKKMPLDTLKVSLLGSINMLENCLRLNGRILQASTSEVYGDPIVHPQTESYWGNANPIGTRACYTEGKRCAETLFFEYRRQHKLDIKIIRIFNTYGPRMHPDDGRVVASFIKNALINQPLEIFGDGSQTRSFCYVDDLVDGITEMMRAASDCPGPINLGNPTEISILALAEMIIALTNSRSNIVRRPRVDEDPWRRSPDISAAQKILGWEPKVKLHDGLLRTIQHFDRILTKTEGEIA